MNYNQFQQFQQPNYQQPMMPNQQMPMNQFQPQQQFDQQQYQMPFPQQQQFQYYTQQQQFPQQFPQQQQFPMQFQQFYPQQMGYPNMMPMMGMMPQFQQFPGMNLNFQQSRQMQMPQWQIMEKQQIDQVPQPGPNETNENYQFKSEFLRVADYNDEKQLEEKFPHLLNINQTTFNIPSKAVYFIIRCATEDDVHKAIKYKIWTSTARSNQTLSSAWRENEKLGIPIFLFFSAYSTKTFYGVAKMISDIQADKSFKYWGEGARFFGLCDLEWIFVKNLDESSLTNITDNGVVVTQLKDCHSLDNEIGKDFLNVFIDALNEPNLIQKFAYYDRREDVLVDCRDDEQFENTFNYQAKQYSTKQSQTKRIQNEEKEYVQKYSAKDSTVNFNDGKQLDEVFMIKSKPKKQSQKQKKKATKKEEEEKKEEEKYKNKNAKLAEYENQRAQPILYESDDQEPEIEKIENKMDYSDNEEEEEKEKEK